MKKGSWHCNGVFLDTICEVGDVPLMVGIRLPTIATVKCQVLMLIDLQSCSVTDLGDGVTVCTVVAETVTSKFQAGGLVVHDVKGEAL